MTFSSVFFRLMIHKHHSGDRTTTEIQNQKSWKWKQTPSYPQQVQNHCPEWSRYVFRATVCLFLSFFLKGEALRIAVHGAENLRKNFGLHSISTFLCGATSALALAGGLFLYTHSAFIPLMRAPVLWELASLGLDRARSAVLLYCM